MYIVICKGTGERTTLVNLIQYPAFIWNVWIRSRSSRVEAEILTQDFFFHYEERIITSLSPILRRVCGTHFLEEFACVWLKKMSTAHVWAKNRSSISTCYLCATPVATFHIKITSPITRDVMAHRFGVKIFAPICIAESVYIRNDSPLFVFVCRTLHFVCLHFLHIYIKTYTFTSKVT